MISQIAKASLKSKLLIDFNCYVDTEFGLLSLIKDNYMDDNVFDRELLNQDSNKIILSLINRKKSNPLSIIANKQVSDEDLDDYYKEFMDQEYDKILELSVITELKSLIELSKTEPAIHVTILCKDQREIDILKDDDTLENAEFILDKLENDYSKYSSFYFKYINENIDKFIYRYKTYYFSKYMINFDDKYDLKESNIVNKIIYSGGSIEILDLYNKSYLGG